MGGGDKEWEIRKGSGEMEEGAIFAYFKFGKKCKSIRRKV